MHSRMNSKWGVSLEGDKIDLYNLRTKLNGSYLHKYDFFISIVYDIYILRTAKLDQIEDPKAVFDHAKNSVQILNGCLHLVDVSPPVKIGTVFEFGKNGEVESRTRVSGPFTVYVRKPESELASPVIFKRALKVCGKYNYLADCVTYLAQADDWYNIYKSLESLELHFGGENPLLNKNFGDKPDIKRLKRTANSFRHSAGRFEPIAAPASLQDAKTLLLKIIDKAFKDAAV
jgi:hypothetical protein